MDYDGNYQVIIKGIAASDQDILKLISNLSSKNLVSQASLGSMSLPRSSAGGVVKKGFKIFVSVKKG